MKIVEVGQRILCYFRGHQMVNHGEPELHPLSQGFMVAIGGNKIACSTKDTRMAIYRYKKCIRCGLVEDLESWRDFTGIKLKTFETSSGTR